MNSLTTTSQNNEGVIIITEEKRFEDGSIELGYSLDTTALDLCAKELEKETNDLAEEEIHDFVQKNIGLALKCHSGWRVVKK
jgi:hypothetical protein